MDDVDQDGPPGTRSASPAVREVAGLCSSQGARRDALPVSLEDVRRRLERHRPAQLAGARTVRGAPGVRPDAARGLHVEEDVARYLESVAALPTIQERRLHMQQWVDVFRHRPRQSIRPHEIRAQRDRWLTAPRTDQQGRPRPPYAAGSVNKRLRALSNLWRVLDGRHAPNPVREVPEADEIEGAPRALPYPVIRAILDAMPDVGRAAGGERRDAGSQTRARLAVLAWTGLAHMQLEGLRPEDIDWEGRSLWVRGRRKGAAGKVRQGHRKPITDEAIAALHRFDELDCWGSFSRSSMRQSLQRACRRVEQQCKKDGVEVDLSRFGRTTSDTPTRPPSWPRPRISVRPSGSCSTAPPARRNGMRGPRSTRSRRRPRTLRRLCRPNTQSEKLHMSLLAAVPFRYVILNRKGVSLEWPIRDQTPVNTPINAAKEWWALVDSNH